MELSFTVKNVLAGATILGIVGGVLGSFALLRRQSLLGDALAHAALPGVCIAFLITGSKDTAGLFIGALIAGLIGAVVILNIVRWSRVKEDSAMGIVLSVFFGLGIVLLTYIQKLPLGNQSGLDKFLFGQAATLMRQDVQLMAVLAGLTLATVILLYKGLKIVSFDSEFGASMGLPVRALELILTILLVVVVVVGLQTVGVVLMVATLITPAAAARQWTERLGTMLVIAAIIGGGSGALGALASSRLPNLPTGPVIVVVSSAILIVSLLMAPERGLAWELLRQRSMTRRIRKENLLKDLYRVAERADDWESFISLPHVMGLRGHSATAIEMVARRLAREDLVEREGGALRLTDEGRSQAARVVRKHRLWEVYLTRRLELPSDHVHRDAEAMEHALSDRTLDRIDELLGFPERDPHGQPIPRPIPRPTPHEAPA